MPYMSEVCKAGKTIQYSKYFTIKWPKRCKGERRGKRIKPTKESQAKGNMRRRLETLTRIMNANFRDGDFLVTLDYRKSARPEDRERMLADSRNFFDRLRRRLKKLGRPLKYIHVIERGSKGAVHHHLLLPEMDVKILRECWTQGGIHIDPLYTDGQYRKIAEYFIKYTAKTIKTDGAIMKKYWYASTNLIKPEPEKEVIKAGWFKKVVHVPDGYYLDKDSVVSGVNEYGFEYFTYTIIQLKDKERRESG